MIQEQQTSDHSAKFAFFYLLSLVALVFIALPVGMILFQIINKYIPDPISPFGQSFSSDLLRFAIAALIVATPVFFLISRQIYKNLFQGVLAKDAGVRKSLTYFILLVSSLIMLGWFISVINNYLGGELTIKSILKALAAVGIAAVVFTFYLHDIRREQVVGQKDKMMKMYCYGSLIVIVIAFIAALFTVESPQQARARKLDNAILNNFEVIASGLDNYYADHQKLPANLEVLKSEILFVTEKNLKDPDTGQLYEYQVLGDKRYQLCAVFKASNIDDQDMISQVYRERWPHQAGSQCLSQSITPTDRMISA